MSTTTDDSPPQHVIHPRPPAAPQRITLASYNIHRCIGSDGHLRPNRILSVLRAVGADIVALQEVAVRPVAVPPGRRRTERNAGYGGPAGGPVGGNVSPDGISPADLDQLAYLSRSLGYHVVAGPNLLAHRGRFGNALLSRFPVLTSEPIDLAVPGNEPRAALDVRLDCHGTRLRVIATHLGLKRFERREQVARLMAALASSRDHTPVTAVLGDFNEWLHTRTTLLPLDATLGQSVAPRTFPARYPTFRLDRIWVSPHHLVRTVDVVATDETRVASDHLPIRMVITLP